MTGAPSRPAWLYGQGCCDRWSPESGCSDGHTGRPAMSLRDRELGTPDESRAALEQMTQRAPAPPNASMTWRAGTATPPRPPSTAT